jgi:hypothetical protein
MTQLRGERVGKKASLTPCAHRMELHDLDTIFCAAHTSSFLFASLFDLVGARGIDCAALYFVLKLSFV